jgi:CubicO group peptidase (beta-lactamase class C family)
MQVDNFANIKGVVVSYQNTDVSQVVSGELIFGAIASKGKLPVTINSMFPVNFGLQTEKLDRLGFALPENVGMDSKTLDGIEALAQKAISGKMTPGMQILVARHGKVVYQKSFGTHSYDNPQPVQNSDVYDVASITKMVSTLPNVMQAYDQGKVNLDSTVGEMVPAFADSDKKNIRFKELLSHYARLQPWIPFYKKTLDSTGHQSPKYYSLTMDAQHTRQVAENLFIRNDYHDTIIKAIADSKLLPKKEYKYSDFTFIILKEYLEKSTGKTLDSLSQQNFYRSLGMTSTTYNPLHKIDMSAIPPTENDHYFRYQTIQGYVHDMEAAMEGGVGGHAGIFSNTMDIAKMMQLYLQKGHYGGQRYFSEKTFNDFNTCWFCSEGNRRGLGFDKQQLPGQAGPTCGCVSSESFGHTGFTGGIAWADPESDLIYVFLSNRTYPDSNAPNTLSKQNIREDIQKIIQQAIVKP